MTRLIQGSSPLVTYGSVLMIMIFTPGLLRGLEVSGSDADTVVLPLRDTVYNHALSTEEIRQLHTETISYISTNMTDPFEVHRSNALAHYYLGRWYQAIKTKSEMIAYADRLRADRLLSLRKFYTERDSAMAAYRDARTECEKLLEIQPNAETHRLYGEILGQMLFLGDAGEIMSIGRKARRNVNKALELDPHLIKAMIQEASRLAYTPISYGGNPDKARMAYREILQQDVRDSEDLFNIYGGFAMAAFAEGDDNEALAWFEEALGIFPGNIFASGMADFIRSSDQ